MVTFYRLVSGRIIPTVLGKGQRFPGFGPPPTPWSFNSGLELSWYLWMCHFTIWLRTSLVMSAILVPFDSNQFMLCPWAMSSFQKLCPAPFPPVTVRTPCSLLRAQVQPLVRELRSYWPCGMAKNKQTNKTQSFKNTSLSWARGQGRRWEGGRKQRWKNLFPPHLVYTQFWLGLIPQWPGFLSGNLASKQQLSKHSSITFSSPSLSDVIMAASPWVP